MKYVVMILCLCGVLEAKNYAEDENVTIFIEKLVKNYEMNQTKLEKLFMNVQEYKAPLRLFAIRAKKKVSSTPKLKSDTVVAVKKAPTGTWEKYSRYKVNDRMVNRGVAFIHKHQTIFDKVEKKYGIPTAYIAAIIGIETLYGKQVGTYKVLDNLIALSFEKNRRQKFFKKELEKFLHLAQTEAFNPRNVNGSYAAAIGLGQFIPSNYEAYGVDYDGDGHITLQRAGDAIASIANYFKKNGWQTGEVVATRAQYEGNRFDRLKTGYKITYAPDELVGIKARNSWNYDKKIRLIKLNKKNYDELWFAAKNFFVITRYNHSSYYAMSVHQLAKKIKKKRDENNSHNGQQKK